MRRYADSCLFCLHTFYIFTTYLFLFISFIFIFLFNYLVLIAALIPWNLSIKESYVAVSSDIYLHQALAMFTHQWHLLLARL